MDYSVDGAGPAEATVRATIAKMAPAAVPNRIVFLPAKQYVNFARQVQQGSIGNRRVGAGAGSDERYGMSHTQIGDGLSAVGAGQTWVNADVLKNPNRLATILAHELGHYHAAAVGGNASEEVANQQRDVYLNRVKQAQQIESRTAQLPPSAQGILSGALRGIQAAPPSPLANLAENNIK